MPLVRVSNASNTIFPITITVDAFSSAGGGYPTASVRNIKIPTSDINAIQVAFTSTGRDTEGQRRLAIKAPNGTVLGTSFNVPISVIGYDYILADYTSGSWGASTTDYVTFSAI